MPEEEYDDGTAVIAHNRFILHMIVLGWRAIVILMAVGGVLGGLAVQFGPATTKGSIPFRLMANLMLPNEVFAWLMVLGGVLLLFRRIATWGHVVLAVCFAWWALVIFYTVFFSHQESSLVSCTWSGTLAGIHLVAAWGRVAIAQFMRTLNKTQGETSGNG